MAERGEADLLQDHGRANDDALVEALARGARRQTFARGALLYEEGRTAEFLHILLDGAVALSAIGNDRRATIFDVVHPVDCFGLGPVLEARAHTLTARTVESSCVLFVAAKEVRRRVASEPLLAQAMLRRLAAQNQRLVEQIKDLKLRSGSQRLGRWLLGLVDEHGGGELARLDLPKGLLAQRLGMTAESLSRAFSTLRGQGVAVQGSTVRIVDRGRLETFCRSRVA